MTEEISRRPVRSFVRREGRLTSGQARALEELWPRYGIEHGEAPLDFDALYGRSAPRCLEIGFGNGELLLWLAQSHPEVDYLGIEVHRPGVGRLLLGLERLHVGNVRVLCRDAVDVLANRIPRASLDEILLLFPDPWPKKRHHKRRIVQPEFVALVASRLKSGGHFRLATDWEPYAAWMLEVIGASPEFRNAASGGGCVDRPERGATRFERRGQRLGHSVFDFEFRRA